MLERTIYSGLIPSTIITGKSTTSVDSGLRSLKTLNIFSCLILFKNELDSDLDFCMKAFECNKCTTIRRQYSLCPYMVQITTRQERLLGVAPCIVGTSAFIPFYILMLFCCMLQIPFEVSRQNIRNLEGLFDPGFGFILRGTDMVTWLVKLLAQQ